MQRLMRGLACVSSSLICPIFPWLGVGSTHGSHRLVFGYRDRLVGDLTLEWVGARFTRKNLHPQP